MNLNTSIMQKLMDIFSKETIRVIPGMVHFMTKKSTCPIYQNGKAYVSENLENDFYMISELQMTGQLRDKGEVEADFIYKTCFDFFPVKENKIYRLNPESLQLELIFELPRLDKDEQFAHEVQNINEVSFDEIQIEVGRYNSGCHDFVSYIINKYSGEKIFEFSNDSKIRQSSVHKYCTFLKVTDTNEYYYYSNSGQSSENTHIIFNPQTLKKTVSIAGNTEVTFQCSHCEYGTYIGGYKIENGEFKYIYLGSLYKQNKTQTRYFLPFNFDSQLWKLIGCLFRDEKTSFEEVRYLDSYQLSVLKNFIFAKHNYEFNSDFYRAYYSIFEFYSNELASNTRTKDVNSKLTKSDIENLKIITGAMGQKN